VREGDGGILVLEREFEEVQVSPVPGEEQIGVVLAVHREGQSMDASPVLEAPIILKGLGGGERGTERGKLGIGHLRNVLPVMELGLPPHRGAGRADGHPAAFSLVFQQSILVGSPAPRSPGRGEGPWAPTPPGFTRQAPAFEGHTDYAMLQKLYGP